MVLAFADIDSEEDIDLGMVLDHAFPSGSRNRAHMCWLGCGVRARHPRYKRPRILSARPLSAISLAPSGPGDITPRIMVDWGQESCRGRQASTPISSPE